MFGSYPTIGGYTTIHERSTFVGTLKSKRALMIFDRHADLKYRYGNRHFWSRGYYVDTVRKNAKMINDSGIHQESVRRGMCSRSDKHERVCIPVYG